MARGQVTRRQKDISRLLRERKQIYRDKLKAFKKKIPTAAPGVAVGAGIIYAILSICTSGYAETYMVKSVIDGYTLKLTNGETVRLIGIDVLEDQADGESITKIGEETTEFVKSLGLEGKEVTLEHDVERKDRHGRILAYAYILVCNDCTIDGLLEYEYILLNHKGAGYGDHYLFLNATIIKAGYASPMTIQPNVKYADLFLRLYQEAREWKRGLWAEEETVEGSGSFEDFLNGPIQKQEKPKGLWKYIDPNGVKMDTSF
ncbi:MAG: thermonuclease family protein [Candidatus Omnitrophica bacterium]|nr:thermonuclease family protein [Candidatus Omnitrophota bacterium]